MEKTAAERNIRMVSTKPWHPPPLPHLHPPPPYNPSAPPFHSIAHPYPSYSSSSTTYHSFRPEVTYRPSSVYTQTGRSNLPTPVPRSVRVPGRNLSSTRSQPRSRIPTQVQAPGTTSARRSGTQPRISPWDEDGVAVYPWSRYDERFPDVWWALIQHTIWLNIEHIKHCFFSSRVRFYILQYKNWRNPVFPLKTLILWRKLILWHKLNFFKVYNIGFCEDRTYWIETQTLYLSKIWSDLIFL